MLLPRNRPCVCYHVCVSAADVIEMPPHIDNMFLQIVSLRQGQTDTAAFPPPSNGNMFFHKTDILQEKKGSELRKFVYLDIHSDLMSLAQLCK